LGSGLKAERVVWCDVVWRGVVDAFGIYRTFGYFFFV
jgi:hypothetical protein